MLIVLLAEAQRDAPPHRIGAYLVSYALLLGFGGYFGGYLVVGPLAKLVIDREVIEAHEIDADDDDSIVDGIKAMRLALLIVAFLLWGWHPSDLPGDPGDLPY